MATPPRRGRRRPAPAQVSVTALGGGHGLSATLQALRHVTEDLTAVVTVAVDGAESTPVPAGVVPLATAVLETEPASRSVCVTAYEAVQVRLPPGARVPVGQAMAGAGPEPVKRVSATRTADRLTLPVLRTTRA